MKEVHSPTPTPHKNKQIGFPGTSTFKNLLEKVRFWGSDIVCGNHSISFFSYGSSLSTSQNFGNHGLLRLSSHSENYPGHEEL